MRAGLIQAHWDPDGDRPSAVFVLGSLVEGGCGASASVAVGQTVFHSEALAAAVRRTVSVQERHQVLVQLLWRGERQRVVGGSGQYHHGALR